MAAPLRIAVLPALATFAGQAAAQIPDGHFVVSAACAPAIFSGFGGLYVAHPRTPQCMTEIANVPADLVRSTYSGTDLVGAGCVVLHPSGDLLVGERGLSGDGIELHRLVLGGLSVTADLPIALGTASGPAELAQIALVDANTVLVGCNFVAGAVGPAHALQVALVDLPSGAVTPLVGVTGMGILNALTYDAATATIYVGAYYPNGPPATSFVYRLRNGSLTTVLGGIQGYATCLVADGGRLWLSSNGGPDNLLLIDPGSPATVTPRFSGWESVNALCREPTTGQLGLCGRQSGSSPQNGVHWFDVGGNALTTLAAGLCSGQLRGALTGIDAAPAPVRYGAPSGWGAGNGNAQSWTQRPHRDALPLAGGPWRLAVDWNGTGPMASAAAVALAPAPGVPLPPFGILAFVDPAILGLLPMSLDAASGQITATVQLPAGLGGAVFHLQAVHIVGTGLAATDAIRAAIH